MSYPINTTVREIGEIVTEGNIIPNEWYYHLKNEKGKIQTNAALILADIVFWYSPIPIYDIKTSELLDLGKRFKGDLLQLNYKYFNNKFGFTEAQSRSALIFLEEKGLIFREFHDIDIGGISLNNVMHIGIYPQKIAEITGKSDHLPIPSIDTTAPQQPLKLPETQKTEPLLMPKPKAKEKDWTTKYTDEQKAFLDYLLNIKPEVGDPIERDHATWWIKSYGIEKIKIALQVYWQRVEKAKQDSTSPMPKHIGKYVRKALNDGTLPVPFPAAIKEETQSKAPPCSEKSNQVVKKIVPGPKKNSTTYTDISMISMNVNEVNDGESVTFQKEIQVANKEESKKEEAAKQKLNEPSSNHQASCQKKRTSPDWKASFTEEERKFLAFLLSIIPAKGESIEEKHATWWIKHFGIAAINVALQVYWQQVGKAKKDSKVPMPMSIGAYVREALNKGTQPFSEADQRNKAFAEQFNRRVGLDSLTITEKYCRFEELGKEWYYSMSEKLFQESLRSTFENYCSQSEREWQTCVVLNDGIQTIQEKIEKSEHDNNERELITFQKEIQAASKEESKKEEAKQKANELTHSHPASYQKKNSPINEKAFFTKEERNYLAYLLNIDPEIGESIKEEHATDWLKHFGIAKIKIALQVYWQQVDKAKKDSEVSMPASIVTYVTEALNKGTKPYREFDHKNKAFAEQFKGQLGWSGLTITEKYCQVEEFGKKFYYNLPEELFKESLKSTFENYCSQSERQSCVA
ncbi:MAG: hypothetical protein JSR85_09065 [Proteobacteria bacterium]|nr:hypothetical protein [Pseudomonadota bacterium]